jgi:hypothetical protein
MHRFDFLVFYTEHVWIFGILDKKQFGILVFWYFGTKPVTGPLHTGPAPPSRHTCFSFGPIDRHDTVAAEGIPALSLACLWA